jgi:sRNA-binding carbon storage regulator CsrA
LANRLLSVKLGFVFPPDATVLRKEIYDKIMAENMAAAGLGENIDLDQVDFGLPPMGALPPIEKK